MLLEDSIIPSVSRVLNSNIGSLPAGRGGVCVCVCVRILERGRKREVKREDWGKRRSGDSCTEVYSSCTLVLLSKVEATSGALLQTWLALLVKSLNS